MRSPWTGSRRWYANRRKAQEHGGDRQRVMFDEERLLPDTEVDRFLQLDETLSASGPMTASSTQVVGRT